MKRRRRRIRWRPKIDPLSHGIVCPRCGAQDGRHGSGGKRACKAGQSDVCPGVECMCGDGQLHFVKVDGVNVWRRSPCLNAVCRHCGWQGILRSIDFERAYGFSRCMASENGCHDVTVTSKQAEFPGDMTITIYCKNCSCVGKISIDPISDVFWQDMEPDQDE